MSPPNAAVRRVRLALAAAAALVLTSSAALSACGGGSEPLSKAELASRGDGICREGKSAADAIQRRPPRGPAEAEAQSRALGEALQGELDDLGALDAPDSLGGPMERYLAARRRALALVALGAEAAGAAQARAYLRTQDRFAASASERRRLARRVGFRVCSDDVPRRDAGR
ncbi:MAG: hypothetical protein EXQ70_04745 [Solirubrobacterales bacterium]|nr:hypothetical protein [Solirubrobacterales bacterium]